MKMRAKKPIYPILFAVVLFVLLIPTIYTFLLSMKNYAFARGFFGSESVGFEHFEAFLSSPYFKNVTMNTLSVSLISLFVGAIYTFLASMAIGGTGNRWIKSVLAIVFAVPFLFPSVFIRFFFPLAVRTGELPIYQLLAGLYDGLKLAGLVSFFALFIKDDVFKNGFKLTLLFVVLRLVMFLSPDLSINLLTYNPGIYETADILPTYAYRAGLVESNIGFSSAVGMFTMFVQLIIAIPMIFVVKYAVREEKVVRPQYQAFSIFSISAITPVIFFVVGVFLCSSLLPAQADFIYFAPSYARGILVALFSAVLVAFASYGVVLLGRNSGIFGIIGITALCATTGNVISEYMLIHNFGIYNTHIGVIAYSLSLVPVFSLLMLFATKGEASFKKDIAVVIGAILVIFAWKWGDPFFESIILEDFDKYTAALMIKNICIKNDWSYFGEDYSSLVPAPLKTAFFTLFPIITAAGGSMLVALLNKANKEISAPVQMN